MQNQKTHFICYANEIYKKSQELLIENAKNTNWFDTITAYNTNLLTEDFKQKFNDILNLPRGGGYWIWKYNIIMQKFAEINDNDIIIYIDSGCRLNKRGEKRFFEYIEMINNNETGFLSFQMCHKEKNYTTKEIFNYFNVINNTNITETGQYVGGILFIRKCKLSEEIINKCYNCLLSNKLLFTDYYNNNQEEYFKDNRHDQSIMSVIRKMYNTVVLQDETYFEQFGGRKSLKFPVWAMRCK